MGRQLMVQNLASRNENWIQTWHCGEVKHVSQKYYSKNMSLMLPRNIGLTDMKPAKLHKMGTMAFKTPESVGHQGENFWNFGLQIAGKCISDIFLDLKQHMDHLWQTPFPLMNIMVWW